MIQTASSQVLILGGGYAGLMAAARLAHTRQAQITLIDARPFFAQRIRYHELLAGATPQTLDYAPLLARRGIRFVQGRVEALDPQRQQVRARAADGARLALGYDQLVLALGSTTRTDTPGVAEHALRLDDPQRIQAAQAELRALAARGARLLVVGAGLTGIETASELAERYPMLRVTLATQGRVGDDLSLTGRAYLRRQLATLGVELREQVTISALEQGAAVLANGETLPFDRGIWTVGMIAPGLAREAGLAVDPLGRVLVGPTLQALGQPSIFAAGDAVAAQRGDRTVRMGCVSAMPTGAQAGENLRRMLEQQPLRPFAMDFVVRCISLGRHAALVQRVTAADTPRELIWTRRAAVLTKALINRGTLLTVHNELRWKLRVYPTPGSSNRSVPLDARATS